MKQQKNKKKQGKEKVPLSKKISYIGIGAALSVGCATLYLISQLPDISLLSEHPGPITLPTPAPVSIQQESLLPQAPAPTLLPTEVAEPTPLPSTEPAVEPVFQEAEPLTLLLPVEGEILMRFSMDALIRSKTLGDWRTHDGVDILADNGTEVKSAADGVVSQVYQDPLMGHTIVITHQDDYQTLYQNLASTEMVKTGQSVTKGQVIAAVGSSAPAELLDKSHLHFSLKEGETFVNPMEYLSPTE